MKKLLNLLPVLCLFIWACEDDDFKKIEGYIYKNCNKEPIPVQTFRLVGRGSFLTSYESFDLGEMTSRSDGHFEHMFETDKEMNKHIDEVVLIRANGSEYLRIQERKIDKTGIYYEQAISTHKLVIRTDEPFTSADTIYVASKGTPGNPFLKIPGPFEDRQSQMVEVGLNLGITTTLKFQENSVAQALFWWGMGYEEYQKVSFDPSFRQTGHVIGGFIPGEKPAQPVCGQGDDIIIDLRGK